MKKTIILSVALLLLLVPVMARDTDGENVDKVIIASTENYPDAIVSSSVSQKLGIPILLTEKDEIPSEVQSTLGELNPTEVTAVGGPAVISNSVVNQLKEDYDVTRLWGMTRYGTAQEVAAQFWPEGAKKALLVENELGEKKGNVMAAAKDLAEGNPMLPIPEGKIPAGLLSQLKDMDVERVTIVGSEISQEMESSLEDLNITIQERIQARNENRLQERLRNRSLQHIRENETLVVVAVGNFRDTISAPNLPQARSFLVSSEEEISDAVDAVNERGIQKVKVVGKPDLAENISNALKEQTEAEVDLVSKGAASAAQQAAEMARQNMKAFAKRFRNRHGRWSREIEQKAERIKEKANKTIEKAKEMIDDFKASELQGRMEEVRNKFSQGKYFEALTAAREIKNQVHKKSWNSMKDNWTALHKQIRQETQDIREKTQELAEIGKEFGKSMRQNMTVEERLETIEEFRGRRMGKVKELVEQPAQIGGIGEGKSING